jgi:hypothetical protein
MTHFTPYIPVQTVISASALQPVTFNPFLVNPIIPATILPIYPNVVAYQDVNNDRHLKAQVVEYFYNKILNNWLKFHYNDLYALLTVSGGKVALSKNVKDTEDTKNNDIKYDYIIDNYLRKKDILQFLSKFRKMNNLNWWDIKHFSEKVRLYIHYKVKQYMKEDSEN